MTGMLLGFEKATDREHADNIGGGSDCSLGWFFSVTTENWRFLLVNCFSQHKWRIEVRHI